MLGAVRPRSAHNVNDDRKERETDAQDELLARHEGRIARLEHTAQRR